MSTQPSSDADLDRTDELPQLDVAAYEASMAEAALSSTDTWSVQSLRDATLDEEDIDERPAVRAFRPKTAPERTSDLTLDAERILSRVAQLEAELAAARTLGEQLEERCESLQSEIADQHRAFQALQADNARLGEQHSIGLDKVQSLERQLQERAVDFDAQTRRMQASHAAATEQAEASRRDLEQRVAVSMQELAALSAVHARLQEELRTAVDLAQARAAEIEDLQDRLDDQQDDAAKMARYLAAKVVENDTLSTVLEQRKQAIEALQATSDALGDELQRTEVQLSDATQRAEGAERELAAVRDERRESDQRRDEELAGKGSEIVQLRADVASLQARAGQLEMELAAAGSTQDEQRKRNEALEVQLAEGQQEGISLAAQLASATTQIQDLERRAAELIDVQAELGSKRDELVHAHEQLATLRAELADLAGRFAEQKQRLEAATADLEAAHEIASQSAPAIEGLEIAVRARDELVGSLRAELQIAQDERAIMAGQLQKARARNKTLAHEVFQRDKRIATLQEDLAVHAETLAAIRQDISRVGAAEAHAEGSEPQRMLEAVGHDGAPILLNRKVVTVGRTSDNDACIPSKLVSRHHARLLVGPNAVIVEDAGSTNGCYVNDRLVKQQLMRDGDVLSLGDLRYRLRTVSAQSPRATNNVVALAERDGDPE